MKDRTLLMIPGPIEFEPAVLSAMGAPTHSHAAPEFISIFSSALKRMREVWRSPQGQPFIIAGSGTLAMEIPAANLVEAGDNVLVISTGYFGARYRDLLERFGADVTVLEAEIGGTVSTAQIEAALKKKSYKLLTFTHVDTSTAVKTDAREIGRLGQEYGVLTILDGVCSVAGEEICQQEWGLDVVLTASQKAVGVPPGLALLVVSEKAMTTWKNRNTPVAGYYVDWKNWLPIMEAYEAGKPSYFGTPPVNLISALDVGLGQILVEGLDARFKRHQQLAAACRAGLSALGLGMVPLEEDLCASTLSAPRYPDGVSGAQLLPLVKAGGAVVAGGLHGEIKNDYFRIGHMGAVNRGDILAVIAAVEAGLSGCGYSLEKGAGVAAVQRTLAI